MRFWTGAVALAALALVGCGEEAPSQPSPDVQETRAIMRRISSGDLKVLSALKKSDDGQSFALGMWPARSMNLAPP